MPMNRYRNPHEPRFDGWRQMIVTIDDDNTRQTCWTKGELWNGWQCPRFTREEGDKVLKAIDGLYGRSPDDDLAAYFDEESDSFVFPSLDYPDDPERFPGRNVTIEGEGDPEYGGYVHVYEIGAWCWIWSPAIEYDADGYPIE